MADVTPTLNQLLKSHSCEPVRHEPFSIDRINEFLKEAYQINSRTAELLVYLRSIRQPYLSNAPPPRRTQASRNDTSSKSRDKGRQYFTDTQRDQIDAEAKAVLRELYAAVNSLAQAEQVRQNAEDAISAKRRRKQGFGALGHWASGGATQAKTPEEELEDATANLLKVHREAVVWFLQRRLEECGSVQSHMMEIRVHREMEKSKSVLYKTRGSGGLSSSLAMWDEGGQTKINGAYPDAQGAQLDELEKDSGRPPLTEDQMQIFAKENQSMLKMYEDKLDQARAAERSLVEISELQSTLAGNLELQSAHIDQLVQDSELVTTNVGQGNRELKKATERRSTARLLFYSTCALCSFLVVWDLVI